LGVWCTYEALLPLRKFLKTITEYSFLIFKQLRKFFFNHINNISIINIEPQQYSRDSYYHISLEIMKPSTNNSVTI
ncbi:11141_t:CDS:2, partial [Gigaspora rosea]